jgi:pyruvate dehydrogenase E1 component beta subunit
VTSPAATQIVFSEAITEALRMEMYRDLSVVCMSAGKGQATRALGDAFGDERVVTTSAVGAPIVLAAAGAAEEGLRPVCELGPGEGGAAALEEIAEIGALYAAGGVAPGGLTVRISWGDPLAGGGAAADPLGFLLGFQGIKVVEPACAADAKGLIVSALRDDAPVCVLEHVALLGEVGVVPEGAHEVEIGRARLDREGDRLTVISHGLGVEPAQRAVDGLGVGADLLDLRTLQPLDTEAVLTSVRKTGRVLIVEPYEGGARRITAALVAAIWEEAFEFLDAAPRRVQLERRPMDASDPRDDVDAIAGACDELLRY